MSELQGVSIVSADADNVIVLICQWSALFWRWPFGMLALPLQKVSEASDDGRAVMTLPQILWNIEFDQAVLVGCVRGGSGGCGAEPFRLRREASRCGCMSERSGQSSSKPR